jgi:hypothetical protein
MPVTIKYRLTVKRAKAIQDKNKEAFNKSYYGQLKLKNDVDTRPTNNTQ